MLTKILERTLSGEGTFEAGLWKHLLWAEAIRNRKSNHDSNSVPLGKLAGNNQFF